MAEDFPAPDSPEMITKSTRWDGPRPLVLTVVVSRVERRLIVGTVLESCGASSSGLVEVGVEVAGDLLREVADALQELELGRVVREDNRRPGSGLEDLLDPLGQRDDRDAALAEALERLEAGRELALPAVDDDEVGQGRERRVALGVVRRALRLLAPLPVPAGENLAHCSVIVAGLDLAD